MCHYSRNLDKARANAQAQKEGKVWPHLEPDYCGECKTQYEELREFNRTVQRIVAHETMLPAYLK